MLYEFRGWKGVRYLNFSEVRAYVVVKTSQIEMCIGVTVLCFSFRFSYWCMNGLATSFIILRQDIPAVFFCIN